MEATMSLQKLRFASRIPSRSLKQTDDEHIDVLGLCALPDDVVLIDLFIRTSSQYCLRALSLRSQQLSRDGACALEQVYCVAYDKRTDTLLCVCGDDDNNNSWLVSLRRVASASDWLEVQRLRTQIPLDDIGQLVVSDSRVLLAQQTEDTNRLHTFDMSEPHGLRPVGAVVPDVQFWRFACSRVGADTLVAFVHETAVSLHRLAALQLEPLAQVDLTDPRILLFRGDLLLVADWSEDTKTHAVVPLLATGGRLTRLPHLLLDAANSVAIDEWCLSSDHLVVLDWKSKDLLKYAFE